MKSFPFDSQVTYDGQGNPSYDRGVNSADLADNIALLYTNGVLPNPSTCLQVTESENQMSVLVHPGACCINGRLGKEENIRTIVFEASSTIYDRIDRVVLRLNTNVDVRDIDIYVVKGVPSASPVAPELTRTGGIYELALANVFIAKNTNYISVSRITDTRFVEELCGIMKCTPENVDLNSLYKQIFDWMKAEEQEFINWVDSLKNILDEETAGHLQLEIDEINSKIEKKQDKLVNPITQADVVNNTASSASNLPLSAAMGKSLKDYADQINNLAISANTTAADAQSRVGNLENVRNSVPFLVWNVAGDDIDWFFAHLRNNIIAHIPVGTAAFIGGSWSGHYYMAGWVIRTGENTYNGMVDFSGAGTYMYDYSGFRQVSYV